MENWTGAVFGTMHIHRITTSELASKVGWCRQYLSAVLNGKVSPVGAEAKIRTALQDIIDERKEAC